MATPTPHVLTRTDAIAAGRAYWFLGNLAIVHLTGEETGGSSCVVELTEPPGFIPLHAHRNAAQITYVLEGDVTVYMTGATRELGVGDSIYQPAGVRKTAQVTSTEPARVLDVNLPAGFERFIAAAGEPARNLELPPPPDEAPDFERLVALAAEHGLDIIGPPGELP